MNLTHTRIAFTELNTVSINGRLIRDTEPKTFENESTLCTFFIATDGIPFLREGS